LKDSSCVWTHDNTQDKSYVTTCLVMIQVSKDFDGGLSIPTVKGFNKKLWNTTMATYQPQIHLPTPNTKGGWTHDKKVIATTIYHWIGIQSKDFDGGL